MTGRASGSAPDDLFEAIARLLEPGQREYFYQRMLYFRHLRPEDELLRLVEAIGLLALLIREAPHAVAREREHLAELLETSLATISAAGAAGQAYQRQLDERLTGSPPISRRGSVPRRSAGRSPRVSGNSSCNQDCRPRPTRSRRSRTNYARRRGTCSERLAS